MVTVMIPNKDTIKSILNPIIRPWYDSIKNPKEAQEQVFNNLLKNYAKTCSGI